MKIVIDARSIEKGSFGIARYTFGLISALIETDKKNKYLLLVNSKRLEKLVEGHDNFSLYEIRSKWLGLFEQFEIPWVLSKINPDIFHATSFVVPFFVSCKLVISILDMIHLVFPKQYSFWHRLYYKVVLRRAAKKSSKIITISESSKKDIVKYFNISPDKIRVTYIAASSKFYQLSELEKPQEPYVLLIGSNKPYKNISMATRAFNNLKDKGMISHILIIAGGIGVKKVSDSKMNKLYNGADLFVFPSLYEGFGLPALEAMACGTPVITSNVSSMPEVVCDSALLIDPNDQKALEEAIFLILSNKELSQKLAKKGIERAENFSWNKCAEETLEVYNNN